MALRASLERQKLPFDRSIVPTFPIPSRFDTQTEHKIARDWLIRFDGKLSRLYDQWLPDGINRRKFLELTKIPYAPYFSFGEGLPVIKPGTTDPTGLGFAYETVAALIGNKLQNTEILISNRDEFIRLARFCTRIPKTSLRELPCSAALFIDLVGSSTLRSMLEQDVAQGIVGEDVLEHYQSLIADAASAENGALAMSEVDNFMFAFSEVVNAVRCSLSIQDYLAVKSPIPFEPLGHLRVRMAIHVSTGSMKGMEGILRVASRIASKAQEGQILISGEARQRINVPLENVKFLSKGEKLEFMSSNWGSLEEELFEVVQITPVVLNCDERKTLFE